MAKIFEPTKPVQELADILRFLGGQGRLNEIHSEYARRHPDDQFADNRHAAIRNKLQRNCAASKQWQGKHRIFENPARGIWRLADHTAASEAADQAENAEPCLIAAE